MALPSPTIDWSVRNGLKEIPIEERDAAEVETVTGRSGGGDIATVTVTPPGTHAVNPAFDVTPARLVTGFITDHGIASATTGGLRALFPDKVK